MSEPYKVIKCRNYQWDSIEKKTYKSDSDSFRDIHRYSLLTDEYKDLNFHTRYFEIQPGGYSSLEYHRHPHSVVILRGRGTVILENELQEISLHDVVFIAPETIHQFHADKDEKLGFLCMVDRYRDKPRVPGPDLLHKRITNPEVLEKVKH
ncbi:MAG: cupin domain-containing protein [Balneolaceae bacterium]